MTNDRSSKSKFILFLKRKHFIEDKDVPTLLRDIKRFVSVVQTIYSEPQAQISIKEDLRNGKKLKTRVFTTNLDELKKVNRAPNEPITIKTIRELHQKITNSLRKENGK